MSLGKFVSRHGYKKNSPDKGKPFNIIPSGNITMKDVDHPVFGQDNQGNSQMMYPGYEYIFPGDMVYEKPVKQDGGATRSDSLALLKNAKSVRNYYERSGNYRKMTTIDYDQYNDAFEDLDDVNKKWNENSDQTISTPGNMVTNKKDITFRKNIDENKFKQREGYNAILDTRSPIPLYDRRIKPQSYQTYYNESESLPIMEGDMVGIAKYEPLAVAPWDTLNEEQKLKRRKLYGDTGTPFEDGKVASIVDTVATKISRTKPDPKRSVVDNLRAMGKDTSFAARKKLYTEAGLEGIYTGSAENNVALNKHLSAPVTEPVVKPVVEKPVVNPPTTEPPVIEKTPGEPVEPTKHIYSRDEYRAMKAAGTMKRGGSMSNDYVDTELTDKEIKALRAKGFRVEVM